MSDITSIVLTAAILVAGLGISLYSSVLALGFVYLAAFLKGRYVRYNSTEPKPNS